MTTSKDGVVQLILTDELFDHIKDQLERRGLVVVPYKVGDPDDLDTYTVGISQALWERSTQAGPT